MLVTCAAAREFEGDDMRRNALILAMTVISVLACTALTGCSREKIDWKSAEAADTVEGYDHFLDLHPDGALATQARTRVAQLMEDRDWKKATSADTAEAYRDFLAQHESGKWSEEARIRVENFSLDGAATAPVKPALDAAPAVATTPAATPPLPAHGPKEAQSPPPAKVVVDKPTVAVKPVAKAAPVAAPAASPPRAAFGIQLGAFHSQDAALKNWKQLQTKYDSDLHGLFAHAVPVKQTSGDLFRLQAPVGEESRARAICASLAKQSQPCVVVLPQP
jgi:cell division septation protein DedD